MNIAPAEYEVLAPWRAAWPQALAAWSRFTRLQEPRLCASHVEAAEEGLSGSFAMIRLADQRVVIDLPEVQRLGLQDYALKYWRTKSATTCSRRPPPATTRGCWRAFAVPCRRWKRRRRWSPTSTPTC